MIEIVNVTVFESYSFITSLKIGLSVRVLLMKNVNSNNNHLESFCFDFVKKNELD